MKNKTPVLIMIVVSLATVLAVACTPPAGSPEGSADGEANTLYVGPELVDCVGVAPQTCMQVRQSPDEPYTLFYDQIEGFAYEEGYEYELLVSVEEIENPPADGSSLKYTLEEVVDKTPVESGSSSEAGQTITLYVGPELVDCVGVAPQKCMQVRQSPDEPYTYFYDRIDGFAYEEGYEYELLVSVEEVENPPADASSLQYTLVEEVDKTPAEAGSTSQAGETITLFVGPELVDCVGVGPQKCMQVRQSPDEPYSLFYFGIEGFEYEEGNEYELLVSVEEVENPPADASSLQYTLQEVVSMEPTTGGASGRSTEEITLEGTRWVLTGQTNAEGSTIPALPGTEVTAEFDEGTVGGSAGCNSYSAAYTVDGNNISIGPGPMTLMACLPPLMVQEALYMANLGSAANYTIDGDTLQIANAGGQTVLNFVATVPIDLTSVTWEAISYNNGKQAVVSLIIGTTITANFGDDGMLSGSSGCNNYNSGYTLDGDTISIQPGATTRKLCGNPEGIMEQEALYLEALTRADVYRIDGSRLELRSAEGALQASYVVQEGDATP